MSRLLICGDPGEVHVGAHFLHAARSLGIEAEIFDIRRAYRGPRLAAAVYRRFFGNRPLHLKECGRDLLERVRTFKPRWLMATGIAPIERKVLDEISRCGVETINYLTDDPWNPVHASPWFFEAMPGYGAVFTVRRSNLNDLQNAGCRKVSYLPFAYAPEIHFPPAPSEAEKEGYASDVVFVGGADRDREPYVRELLARGFNTAVYGGYWERFPGTKKACRGMGDARTIRLATASAAVALCLVRRSNRDGNCMRSFEIPAIGTCMLAEDTAEHREIFGREGEAVLYFKDRAEMAEKARRLLDDASGRLRLAEAAHRRIIGGYHTYKDRLSVLIADGGGGSGR